MSIIYFEDYEKKCINSLLSGRSRHYLDIINYFYLPFKRHWMNMKKYILPSKCLNIWKGKLHFSISVGFIVIVLSLMKVVELSYLWTLGYFRILNS